MADLRRRIKDWFWHTASVDRKRQIYQWWYDLADGTHAPAMATIPVGSVDYPAYGRTTIHRIQNSIQIGGAYAPGDSVGGVWAFQFGAAWASVNHGVLKSLTITDADNERTQFDVCFYDDMPVAIDDAPFDPTGAINFTGFLGHIQVYANDYIQFVDNAVATVDGKGLPIAAEDATGYLYVVLVIREAKTYTAPSDLSIGLGVLHDN